MVFRFLIFLALIFSIAACKQTNLDEDYSNSGTLAFNLLKVCVDKTLNVHSEFNTRNYVLDLTAISTLNQQGIDSFLKRENPILPASLEDTTGTAEKNKDQSRTRVLENIIVKFLEIDFIDKKHVSVVIKKIRTANQVIKVSLDLKREGDSYRIVRQEFRR